MYAGVLPGKSTIENELCFSSRSGNKNIHKFTLKRINVKALAFVDF